MAENRSRKGMNPQAGQPGASVPTGADTLKSGAMNPEKALMNDILKADVLIRAKRDLEQDRDNSAKVLLNNMAKLEEGQENHIVAVLLYIELGDAKSIRRVAPDAADQIGVRSDFGRMEVNRFHKLWIKTELERFSKLKKGSEEEADAVTRLKEGASALIEATKRQFMQFLREESSSMPSSPKESAITIRGKPQESTSSAKQEAWNAIVYGTLQSMNMSWKID
jgi:hypothetical protein